MPGITNNQNCSQIIVSSSSDVDSDCSVLDMEHSTLTEVPPTFSRRSTEIRSNVLRFNELESQLLESSRNVDSDNNSNRVCSVKPQRKMKRVKTKKVKLSTIPTVSVVTRSQIKNPMKRSSAVLDDELSFSESLSELYEHISACSQFVDFIPLPGDKLNVNKNIAHSILITLQRPKKIKIDELPSYENTIIRSAFHEAVYTELQKLRMMCCANLIEMHFIQNKQSFCKNFICNDLPDKLVEFLKTNPLIGSNEEQCELTLDLLLKRSLSYALPEVLQEESAAQHDSSNANKCDSPENMSSHPALSARALSGCLIEETVSPTHRQNSSSKSSVKPVTMKTNSLSDFDDSSFMIGSQQNIIKKVKQEAYVMSKINDLRKNGLWSLKRLPKVQELSRNKAHWDYLLEEMVWLSTDFAQERNWKKAAAKKCARMITKCFQEREMKAEKAEREQVESLKRLAAAIAKEIKIFWTNIEKIVEYKTQTWIEARKKKVIDSHLNFIMDQTEKYSSWLTEGLSMGTNKSHENALSENFNLDESVNYFSFLSDSDKEEIIAKEENMDYDAEEIDLPIEDLLQQCSKGYDKINTEINQNNLKRNLEKVFDSEDKITDNDDLEMYSDESDCEDDEETIAEEEKEEKQEDYSEELKQLQNESEVPIEDLLKKYKDLYNGDHDNTWKDDWKTSDDIGSLNDLALTDQENSLSSSSNKFHFPHDETYSSQEITDIAATAESFQPKGNTLSTTQVCTKIPFLLKHQLREYQHIGLDWLNAMYEKNLNGILADEMGLGKTIQTIALLAHLACEKKIWGPHLIVVPTSVLINWEIEFKKWCPAFKILTYYGTPKERKNKRKGWTKPNVFHVCITSYRMVVLDHLSFKRKRWVYLVLDEAQHIKNFKSQRWKMLLNFQSSHRLLLTGTPLQNNLMELWSLMHFLMPSVFQCHTDFREWFVNPVTGMIDGNHEYNDNLIKRLHKVLRPFLLRRLKSEVEKQLPKKYEHVVMCRLSKRQRFLYDDFMSQSATKETLFSGNFMSVINILMQLRKVCNHPNLFEPRPITSPFMMKGLTYHTASLVQCALDYDPYKHINLNALNLLLADIEMSVSAYAAHRTKALQTPHYIIEMADSLNETPHPPAEKMKLTITTSHGPHATNSTPYPRATVTAQARLTPMPNQVVAHFDANSTNSQRYVTLNNDHQSVLTSRLVNNLQHTQQPQSPEYALQMLQQTSGGLIIQSPIGNQVSAGSFTVQVPTGARMPLNIGRLVQTNGQHLLKIPLVSTMATDLNRLSISTNTTSTLANSNSIAPTAGTTLLPIAASTVLPEVQKVQPSYVIPSVLPKFRRSSNNSITSSSFPLHINYNKPIGRVAPLNIHPPLSAASCSHLSATRSTFSYPCPHPVVKNGEVTLSLHGKENSLSDFHIDFLSVQLSKIRQEKLHFLGKTNNLRCSSCPVYGSDLIEAVSVCKSVVHSTRAFNFNARGFVNCLNALHMEQRPREYWYYTKFLSFLVSSPEKCAHSLAGVIKRFAFVVPSVTSCLIQFHTSHPPPSQLNSAKVYIEELSSSLSPSSTFLHPIISNTSTCFPETRLIEYDCGKLRRLASLLQDLKSEKHRVLIFTQMSRMLDILEQFLCCQGHTYLRLDGSIKIEMRQTLMERFNADKKIFCFILSTRSGGVGVNLTGADTVIFYDSDWNPTMDAQAQDRCHRIGQTRDVYIYRLISEKTVEENILKKANQKRLLGDLAIEGGNFTTAFFKKKSLHDLFGLSAENTEAKYDVSFTSKNHVSDSPKYSEVQFEQALGMTEEEPDFKAAKVARVEAAAEFDEFDETIPFENNDNKDNDKSGKTPAEEDLEKILKQLNPIEKYAIRFFESVQDSKSLERLKQTEEDIESKKREWELGRLKALKEEEQKRSNTRNEHLLKNDDPLLCYARDIITKQVFVNIIGEELPLWTPPTPPADDNEMYRDSDVNFMYEPEIMIESSLPPVFVKKKSKRIRIEPISSNNSAVSVTCKQKMKKDDISIPRSLFDQPTAEILKLRREAEIKKVKGLILGVKNLDKTFPTFTNLKRPGVIMSKPYKDTQLGIGTNPEWLVYEDWSLLQMIQHLQNFPLNLMIVVPGHTPNFDLCADSVNGLSCMYRSPKACKIRYETVIAPRENGKISHYGDANIKKPKKTKGMYKTKANRSIGTREIYLKENSSFSSLVSARFEHMRSITKQKDRSIKINFNPAMKTLLHPAVSTDKYDGLLSPTDIALIRAKRIQREKSKNHSFATISALASSNLRDSQRPSDPTTAEITAELAGQYMVAAVSGKKIGVSNTTSPTSTPVVSVAGLTAAHHLTSALPITTTAVSPLGHVTPSQRNLNSLNQYRQTTLLKQKREKEQKSLEHQQLKRLQATHQLCATPSIANNKIAVNSSTNSSILTVTPTTNQGLPQQQQASVKPSTIQPILDADVTHLIKGQQFQQQKQKAELTTTQILAHAQLQQTKQQQEPATIATAETSVATLVKTVATAPSFSIPVSGASANISVSWSKGNPLDTQARGTTTITNQQLRQLPMQNIIQTREGQKFAKFSQLAKVQGNKNANLSSPSSAITNQLNSVQMIQQSRQVTNNDQTKSFKATMQQIQQSMKQVAQTIPPKVSNTQGNGVSSGQNESQSQLSSHHARLSTLSVTAVKSGLPVLLNHVTNVSTVPTTTPQTFTSATSSSARNNSTTLWHTSSIAPQFVKQQTIQVVSAAPNLSTTPQSRSIIRNHPNISCKIKSQKTTLPSGTLVTSCMLKGGASLQQAAASSATGLTPQQAVTLAIRGTASQTPSQVRMQVQQPSLATSQSTQTRIKQMYSNQTAINIQPAIPSIYTNSRQNFSSSITTETSVQSPMYVARQTSTASNASVTISMLTALSPTSATAHAVQAARQRQPTQQISQRQQSIKSYTMRLRNPK